MLRVLRVFVSSPGDVGEERAIVHQLLDSELKYERAFLSKLSFEVVSWDNPVAPTPMTARLTPQEAVNRFRGKPSDCDIVIVILWSRLGTHLNIDGKPYLSGTEYEYEEAANAKPPPEILVYRRTEKVLLDADDPEFDWKREQRRKALAFFDRFKNADGTCRGGINKYATPTDFKELLEKNLREILAERLEAESVGRPAPARFEPPMWRDAPYPGLRAFRTTEAAIFFGRGRETDALIAELRKPNRCFTAVVGASGSGKSSLVYAGLLPRLAEGAIEGSAGWRQLWFKPSAFGENPFLALAAALKPCLLPGGGEEPIAISDVLAKDPNRIAAYVDQALAGAPQSARLVLFADQSEELFAQAAASRREPFVDLLAEAAGHPQVQVVLTMRADFLAAATRFPRLADLLQTGVFVLGAPGPAALADMIRRPAQLAGLTLDDDLADDILADVGSEPGALPLVAFCLEALYRLSASAHRLTLKAYEDLGGLEGAIRGRAAGFLTPLEKEGVDLGAVLPKLFRLLVHVDAAGTVSRRRAFRDELTVDPILERIVEMLVQGRLLVADDPNRATISLAHEMLLTAWPALESWVQKYRTELQRLDRVMLSLCSVSPLDRTYAVSALGEIGAAAPETVPALITALGDAYESVRENAARALGQIGPPAAQAVSALVTALGDAHESVVENAARALGRIGSPATAAVPALVTSETGLAEAVPALVTALGDARESVRENAARTLQRIGARAAKAEPALVTALGDPHEAVRVTAAAALEQIRKPTTRRLRVYAYNPFLATGLVTIGINEATLQVPWETDLQPGPIGEYVEVVDVDPASDCCYAPVDLNHPHVLAQDGLAPSESNPQFHQQMAYAVAMKTIEHFERALGRVALWAPRTVKSGGRLKDFYVQRLRIYPHGMRLANAFYSPERKALLLGYFAASKDQTGNVLPNGIVFNALSYDIIAHETTHALVDGLHRRFCEPTNPDVLAFHEAFADIVALFQHFTMPEVWRAQIAQTRGNLRQENLLAQLAAEFSQTTSRYSSLRDAIGRVQKGEWVPAPPQRNAYQSATEVHARGAVLVAAVFDAFIRIYQARTEDLLRLATYGTGVLPPGAIPMDLVDRLAREASEVAGQVLTICIRALDYCPPIDITFGEYLRALITADRDLVPDDERNYRVAFISAFCDHGIFPQEVKQLDVGSLSWEPPPLPLTNLTKILERMSLVWTARSDRRDAYFISRANAAELHAWLTNPDQVSDDELDALGLFRRARPLTVGTVEGRLGGIEVHSVRPARRIGPNGQSQADLVVELTQTFRPASPGSGSFRGGCTLLIDLQEREVRYFIRKRVDHAQRLMDQHALQLGSAGALRANYFHEGDTDGEPFAMLHRPY